MPARREPPRPRTPLGDRALVASSALFTTFGAWMAWRGGPDRRTGIGLLTFFGLCLGTLLWTDRQGARARRSASARDVQIAGGVRHRLRIGKAVATAAGVGAALLVVAWAIWDSAAAWLVLLGAFTCFFLAALLAFGPQGRRAVAFEPAGLRLVEPRFEVVLPWDDVADARVHDVHGTLLVLLALREPASLVAVPLGCSAERARRALATLVARSRTWTGADVAVAPSTFGLDPVLFAKAVGTYVSRREARAALDTRASLPGA